MNKKKRLGILGGTFDPIHYGHLLIAETALHEMKLDKIVFIPTGNPPHKADIDVSKGEHRFNMLNLAILDNCNFESSRIELDRPGNTYTYETLEDILKENEGNLELYFIIGADVVFDLINWKNKERVFKLCQFVAILRPGFEDNNFTEQVSYLKDTYGALINIVNMPLIEISSTDIRNRISEGRSVNYMLPSNVIEYIKMNKLYNTNLC